MRFKLHPCLKNNPVVEDLGERLIKHEMQKIVEKEIAEKQSENIPATQGQDQASLRRGGIGEASGSRKSMSKSFSFKQEMLQQVILPVPGPPTPRYNIDNEYRMYQQYMLTEKKDLDKYTEDPMRFWKDNKSTYPLMYQVAKRYLHIPATSVPSERIFSLAGFICRKKRTKLLEEHVNQQIFLAKNKDHIPSKTTVYCHRPLVNEPEHEQEHEVVLDSDGDETQILGFSLQD